MKKMLFILLSVTILCCNNNSDEITDNNDVSCECDGKKIIKVLKDEPAYIVKGCFEYHRVDSFSFDLINEQEAVIGIFSCNEIPEEYRIEGLAVLISGNISSCVAFNGCLMAPNVKLAPTNIFELTDIKYNSR
jgi:hypothetical protein